MSGIHILGASGAGTSTLARAVVRGYALAHVDTDDHYWLPTDPPYSTARAEPARLESLRAALDEAGRFVLSGSLCGWGDALVPRFELVVFLAVPTAVRLERLRYREVERYGAQAVAPGGVMHENYLEFMEYAAGYEAGGIEMRSRALHERWLATLTCPVVRLEGEESVEERLRALAPHLGGLDAEA